MLQVALPLILWVKNKPGFAEGGKSIAPFPFNILTMAVIGLFGHEQTVLNLQGVVYKTLLSKD